MIDAHRRGNQDRTLAGRNAQNHAQMMPDDRARMRRARWVVAPVVVSMAGCVLQPHVTVPQRLLEEPAVLKCRESNTPTCEPYFYGELPAAIAGADELRRSYYEQMRGETALSNSLLALLIPLSAYALYRGIAHTGESTQNMLLKVGIAGSAAYAGVTLFTSKPRQAIYLAGSDALGCAVVASRPHLFTAQDMGDENAPTAGTFLGDIDKLRKLIASVEASLSVAQSASDAAIAEFNARSHAPEKPVVAPRTGAAAPKPPALRLSDPAALKDETSRKTLAEFNTRLAGKPQPVRPAPAKPESAPETKMDHAPELTAVRAKLQDARRALDQGQALKGQIDMAGPRLRGRARQINDEVSREILKTVPDPSAIFSAVSSIGQNAFRLTGAVALKPIPVTESKRPTIVYSLDEQTRSALRIKVEELTNAAAAVTRWVQQVDAMAATVGRLSECRFTAPGLNVIPDIGSVEMAAPSTISFRVSGGTGVPRATVVGVTTSKTPAYELTEHVAEGVYTAKFSLTESASVEDRPLIVFTDGPGNLKREVAVIVVAGNAPDGQRGTGTSTTPLPDKPVPFTGQASDCTRIDDLRAGLGLGKGLRDNAMEKAIVLCKQKLRISPETPALDPPQFCARVLAGECKP